MIWYEYKPNAKLGEQQFVCLKPAAALYITHVTTNIYMGVVCFKIKK